jgi:hypothetical protein
MRLPSGRELPERPLSGIDRMGLRLEAPRCESSRDRFAIAYAVVGLAAGIGARPKFSRDDLIAYGERVCAELEQTEDPDRLLDAVVIYAGPVLVPPGPTLAEVEAAGEGGAPPAGA